MDAGRARRQEELRSHCPASAGSSPLQGRRTATRLRCGVFFFAALTLIACSSQSRQQQTTTRNSLVIGVPESTATGADQGMRQPVAGLSLEGLTALNSDGRALPRLAESWSWENGGRTL